MTASSALVKGGSLRLLMDEIVAAENGLNAAIAAAKTAALVPIDLPSLKVYRWRPAQLDAPALYHSIAPSPFAQRDDLRWRDTINVLVRIAVPYGSDASEMDQLEPYSDLWRQTMDPLLVTRTKPLNGAATWAERTDMRSVEDTFNEVPYACVEFVLQARLDRMINSN